MKRLFAVLAVVSTLLLGACGGENPVAPPKYPDIAGTFQLNATYDGFTQALAQSTGTIGFEQFDRNSPTMSGTANITTRISGATPVLVNVITGITFTGPNTITFKLGNNLVNPWEFTGTVGSNGGTQEIRGTHILGKGSATPFPGQFVAVFLRR